MSISGAQETKTALLEVSGPAGTTQTTALDAQEDREIIGFNVAVKNVSNSGPDPTKALTQFHIGTDQFADFTLGTAETAEQDNLSFHGSAAFTYMDDDTNGNALASNLQDAEWFGEASGVEWNEDSTLTLTVTTTGGDVEVTLAIYYREL